MCVKNKEYRNLSDRELLSLFVSENTASYLLDKRKTTLEELIIHSSTQELQQIKGVGKKTSSRLKALEEIAWRLYRKKKRKMTRLVRPKEVFDYNRDMQHLKQEEARAIYLDIKNQVIGMETVSLGTTNNALLCPKSVYSRAIKVMAEAVIVCHNHPSGIPAPSSDDLKITQKLVDMGQMLCIELLDHVIIGAGEYYSIKENHNF